MFEWDEVKSRRNFAERGFDFEFAAHIFDSDIIEREDARRSYGEKRIVAVGEIGGDLYTIVYTWRGATRRIISARRAHRKERDEYHKAFK